MRVKMLLDFLSSPKACDVVSSMILRHLIIGTPNMALLSLHMRLAGDEEENEIISLKKSLVVQYALT